MNCPKCATAMTRVQLDAGVEVDCCDAHGVWLDVGELQAIIQHRDRAPSSSSSSSSSGPGLGKQLAASAVSSAVSGAGFGVGSGLASALVRALFR